MVEEELMRIHLKTDFPKPQFYDHLFFPETGSDKTWTRMQRGTLNRKDMFTYLMNCGFKVPINGVVKDIVPTIVEVVKRENGVEDTKIEVAAALTETAVQEATKTKEEIELEAMFKAEQQWQVQEHTRIVVYTDEYAHRGEGKILVTAEEALDKYPDLYCSQYVPTRPDGGSASERVVTVGGTCFRIEQASSDWRSNCGPDAEFAITHSFAATPIWLVNTPIFAIDYIRCGNQFLAIDFNEAPDINPLEKYLSSTSVYDVVSNFLAEKVTTVN